MNLPTRRAGRLLLGAVVAAGLTLTPTGAVAETTGATETYLIIFKGSASPSDAAATVNQAGGTVVADYAQIGVLVARSDQTGFGERMRASAQVEGAAATTGFATRVDDPDEVGEQPGPREGLPSEPATDADTFSPLQWNMRRIHTPEAHAITGGSPAVVVGNIDTGVDYRHPDLREVVSDADSANCVSGRPVPGAAAADDDHGHGTHTAGIIAAAANGIGVVGVAPNVRLAAIKASTAEGAFLPEAVVCALVWAGDRGLDVTNNSYFVDPFIFNCRNDPVQRAIWQAVQRAARYAMQRGVTVVAAGGNQSENLAQPTRDAISPTYPPGSGQPRAVTNDCVVLPLEVRGVIGVTATGNREQGTAAGRYPDHLKAFYSSYGLDAADLAAPGGDYLFGATPQSVSSLVLSTWPADRPCQFPEEEDVSAAFPDYPTAAYCYLQGTSMAAPHVAGVAALVVSRFGVARTPDDAMLRPGLVAQHLELTADPQACPQTLPTTVVYYGDVRGVSSGAPQECQGDPGRTSWYGHGEVDALAAVSRDLAGG